MKAAVWYGYKDIRIQEMPEPSVREGYVKVKIDYAGICGTDRHEYVGPNFIPVEKPHRLTGRQAPIILGHEFSGVVVETGSGVTDFQAGDRVTGNGTLSCGVCPACRCGRYNACEKLGFIGVGEDGTFASYGLFGEKRLFHIPNSVTQRQALLAEPLACGIHATRLIGEMESKAVVVMGAGMIGLSCFFAAKLAGAARVLVIGRGHGRRMLVEDYGGTYLNSEEGASEEAIRIWNSGHLAQVVYECVGSQSTLNKGLLALEPCGVLMVMGVFEKPPVLDMNSLQEREQIIMTSQAHTNEIETALQYIAAGRIDTDRLVTKEITLENIVEDGFEELLRNRGRHIKIAVRIG
jgi:(R,R)-butanediol dehydrogenase/meso-butanediol dehydrogenase/diacetyl reductase